MRSKTPFAVIILLTLCVPSAARAQYTLFFPEGPRSVAMGFTGAADAADPTNALLNPAVLVMSDAMYATAYNANPIPEIDDLDLFGIGIGGGYGWEGDASTFTLGASVRHTRLSSDSFSTGDESSAFSLALGLSTEGGFFIGVGASVKAHGLDVSDAMGEIKHTSGTAYDLGIVIGGQAGEEWITRFTVGGALLNNGDDLKVDLDPPDPSTINVPNVATFAVSLRFDSPEHGELTRLTGTRIPVLAMAFNLDVRDYPDTEDSDPETGVAAELTFVQIVSLRAGAISNFTSDDIEPTVGVGVGLPIKKLRLRFDYALHSKKDRDNVNYVGGALGFAF